VAVRPILLLGDPGLYQVSKRVERAELAELRPVVEDLFDTMRDFQARHGWGRAIAAPQIGVHKRLICMRVDAPVAMFNPELEDPSEETCEFWEDCMSFPELLVRLRNPARCTLRYRDPDWRERRVALSGDMAELIQHEVDHLDGVLSIQRAIDDRSIVLRRALPEKDLALSGRFEYLD
jgi:peptide deformylase